MSDFTYYSIVIFWVLLFWASIYAGNRMNNIFKKRVSSTKEISAFPLSPSWTQTDCVALRNFLFQNESGVKLRMKMAAMVSHASISACKDVMHTTHSAAQASGMDEAQKWLLSLASDVMHEQLSQPTGAQVEPTQNRQHDEAAFRESLSP